VKPMEIGGENIAGNLQPLCYGVNGCNNRKGRTRVVDFRPDSPNFCGHKERRKFAKSIESSKLVRTLREQVA